MRKLSWRVWDYGKLTLPGDSCGRKQGELCPRDVRDHLMTPRPFRSLVFHDGSDRNPSLSVHNPSGTWL